MSKHQEHDPSSVPGWCGAAISMKGHKHKSLFAPVVAILLLVGAPSAARELSCPQPDSLPLSAMLLPPPCDTCAETRAELAELSNLQTMRTQDITKHAQDDHERTVDRFLAEIGVHLDHQLLSVNHLFKCIGHIVEDELREAKATFHRTRPYRLPNNKLEILKEVKPDDSFSYPSGHAAYGVAVGLVLIEMIPERREEILRRVEDYGYSRMVAGVHYRSDVYAGQIAGASIVTSLFHNEEFLGDFEKAKRELRRALGY